MYRHSLFCYLYKKDKKPGLSQARALIFFSKYLVSLSNSISYDKDTL